MSVDSDVNFEIIRVRLLGANFTNDLLRAGEDIVDLASQLAPKDTNELSQSGQAIIIGDGKVEISFGNGLPDDRAIAQEFGTVFMEAQPYLFPAIRQIDILKYARESLK